MGIIGLLASQGANPHGPLGWVTAAVMPFLSDGYCGDLTGLLELKGDDVVLDVGCGSGTFLQRCAPQVRHVAGIDQSSIQTAMARRRNRDLVASGKVDTVQGDATVLPWLEGEFTAVTSNCMGCFTRPDVTRRELYRVLRPGGRAAFAIDRVADEATAQRQTEKWDLPYWTDEAFCHLLEAARFADLRTSHFNAQTFVSARKT